MHDSDVRCSATIPARFNCLRKLRLYATPTEILLVGEISNGEAPKYRVIQFDRTVPRPNAIAEIMAEHQSVYDEDTVDSLLRGVYQRLGLARPAAFTGLDTPVGTPAASSDAKAASNADALAVLDVAAWLGVVQFTRSYYLVVVTRGEEIGNIGGHAIHGIRATELVPIYYETPSSLKSTWQRLQERLATADAETVAEGRYQSLFLNLDLSKDFYFSYTMDVTKTVQQQVVQHVSVKVPPATAVTQAAALEDSNNKASDTSDQPSMSGAAGVGGSTGSGSSRPQQPQRYEPSPKFHWNHFLTSELRSVGIHPSWTVVLASCFFQQVQLSLFGRPLRLTLIARRSRYYAGTRYLKRGASVGGHVGNEVEVEQVLEDTSAGTIAAFVQLRGSVPTYWMQRANVAVPKPPIILQPRDLTYAPARRHFASVFARYGAPCLIVNLVKKKEQVARERLIGREFARLTSALNKELPPSARLQFLSVDYNAIVKAKRHNLVSALRDVGRWTAANVGIFCNARLPASLLQHRAQQQAHRERRAAALAARSHHYYHHGLASSVPKPLPALLPLDAAVAAGPTSAAAAVEAAEKGCADGESGPDAWMARLSGIPLPPQPPKLLQLAAAVAPAANGKAGGRSPAGSVASSIGGGDDEEGDPTIPSDLLAPSHHHQQPQEEGRGGNATPSAGGGAASYFTSLSRLSHYPVVQLDGSQAAAAVGDAAATAALVTGTGADGDVAAGDREHTGYMPRGVGGHPAAAARHYHGPQGRGSGNSRSPSRPAGGGGGLQLLQPLNGVASAAASAARRIGTAAAGAILDSHMASLLSLGSSGGRVGNLSVGFPVMPALAVVKPSAVGDAMGAASLDAAAPVDPVDAGLEPTSSSAPVPAGDSTPSSSRVSGSIAFKRGVRAGSWLAGQEGSSRADHSRVGDAYAAVSASADATTGVDVADNDEDGASDSDDDGVHSTNSSVNAPAAEEEAQADGGTTAGAASRMRRVDGGETKPGLPRIRAPTSTATGTGTKPALPRWESAVMQQQQQQMQGYASGAASAPQQQPAGQRRNRLMDEPSGRASGGVMTSSSQSMEGDEDSEEVNLHLRSHADAAAAAARARQTMCCSDYQDAIAPARDANGNATGSGVKMGLGVRMRDYERTGSSAEYMYVDLLGTPHGYHHVRLPVTSAEGAGDASAAAAVT